MSDTARTVSGIPFVCIYADDLEVCRRFYATHFGFEETMEMGPGEAYGTIGGTDMWIGGGYRRLGGDETCVRATAMLGVVSTGDLFARLTAADVRTVQKEPVAMASDLFWFQFVDPSGNVLDVLGPR